MVILPGQSDWRSISELFPWMACIAIKVVMDVYNGRAIAGQ